MIYFNNDYSEGCLPQILEELNRTNLDQTPGYGMDDHCFEAANMIRELCKRQDAGVHFLVGGTQTNLTVIAAALRAHQAVIAATTGHISVHETGAIEATGHKVIELPCEDGKLSSNQIAEAVEFYYNNSDAEHMVQPKMVYISNPTELGTIYSRSELFSLRETCDRFGLLLFLDGARLGYGLTAEGNDVTMADLAETCDVFYIGGTKVGALFGEAVVITSPAVNQDFRYYIKQRGGMLAKGRLLGLQFKTLLKDDLYFTVSKRANALASRIREKLIDLGYDFVVENTTNQLFPILPVSVLSKLEKEFCFSDMGSVGTTHRAIRICTSWATKESNVDLICRRLEEYSAQ